MIMENNHFTDSLFEENNKHIHSSNKIFIDTIIASINKIEHNILSADRCMFKLSADYIEVSIESNIKEKITFYLIIDIGSFELYLGKNGEPVIDYHSLKSEDDYKYLSEIIDFLFHSKIKEERKQTLLGNKVTFYEVLENDLKSRLSINKVQLFKKENEYSITYEPWIIK